MCNIPFPYCVQFCWQFFDMPAITFAKLDKYLQIICKSWLISTVLNLCHFLKWKDGRRKCMENNCQSIAPQATLVDPFAQILHSWGPFMGCWERAAAGLLGCSAGRSLWLSSSTSQSNALDRLAPHHQLSQHHNHRHLRRWFWQNSLRCSPYTSFPA